MEADGNPKFVDNASVRLSPHCFVNMFFFCLLPHMVSCLKGPPRTRNPACCPARTQSVRRVPHFKERRCTQEWNNACNPNSRVYLQQPVIEISKKKTFSIIFFLKIPRIHQRMHKRSKQRFGEANNWLNHLSYFWETCPSSVRWPCG